jgi:hypothetical protein
MTAHVKIQETLSASQPTRFVAKRSGRDRLDDLQVAGLGSLINATRDCSRTATARPPGLRRYTAM